MLKNSAFSVILLFITELCFSQNISNPFYESSDTFGAVIKRIETNAASTIVTFEYLGSQGGWVTLNKTMHLQDKDKQTLYKYLKSEGIAILPEKHVFKNNGERIVFKVHFEKLSPDTKNIDIIERTVSPSERLSFFNFYNVSLERSQQRVTATATSVDSAVVVMSPPIPYNHSAHPGSDQIRIRTTERTTKSLHPENLLINKRVSPDLLLESLTKPETVKKLAAYNKAYYDALVKAGFKKRQAMSIITQTSLLPKMQ